MRDILFRGKRLDNGKWIQGYFVEKFDPLIGTPSHFIIAQDASMGMRDSLCTWHAVDPFTIGQSTGLSDENGKRIFEGDILRRKYYPHEDVIIDWNDGRFCFRKRIYSKDYGYENTCCVQETVRWLKVIGNIHDNPELMEATT